MHRPICFFRSFILAMAPTYVCPRRLAIVYLYSFTTHTPWSHCEKSDFWFLICLIHSQALILAQSNGLHAVVSFPECSWKFSIEALVGYLCRGASHTFSITASRMVTSCYNLSIFHYQRPQILPGKLKLLHAMLCCTVIPSLFLDSCPQSVRFLP